MTQAFALPAESFVMPADEADVLAAAAGDQGAFTRLYNRHVPAVYRYLRARVATQEDAADLTQQVFLRAYRRLPEYRPSPSGFGAWLFRIARNAAIDASRRNRQAIPLDAVPEWLVPHAAGAGPEGAAVSAEAVACVRSVIARLGRQKQELLALRFAAGLSSRQIAAVVGKNEPAVKKQLWRLVQQLREELEDAHLA
jgi:RNA polymerase sigma-70 factor (ECF subfamily)